jgi:hypothetical protein
MLGADERAFGGGSGIVGVLKQPARMPMAVRRAKTIVWRGDFMSFP